MFRNTFRRLHSYLYSGLVHYIKTISVIGLLKSKMYLVCVCCIDTEFSSKT